MEKAEKYFIMISLEKIINIKNTAAENMFASSDYKNIELPFAVMYSICE